jgi:hypothetical protein
VVRFINDDYRKNVKRPACRYPICKKQLLWALPPGYVFSSSIQLRWPVSLERLVAWGAWFWMRGLMMRSDDVMHRLQDCGSAHNLGCVFVRRGKFCLVVIGKSIIRGMTREDLEMGRSYESA